MNCKLIVLSSLLGLVMVSGCGQSEPVKATEKEALKTTVEPLTDVELQHFLRLIARLPDGQVPEFTPMQQVQLDTLLPPKVLVSEFRNRYRQLCDPIRQGEVWDASLDLSKSTRQEGWTSAQLAAFVRCLSCAVMKAELIKKHNLKDIEHQCRQEISKLVEILDREDERPRSTMTEAFMQQREVQVQRLGRMVALLEFTLQLKPIPASNLAVVRKYSTQIHSLLPEAVGQDPFESPFEEKTAARTEVIPAGYQAN